jgi:thioester reductase-like protein
MICAFFACVRLGLIPVPVYPPSSHGFAAALHKMNFIGQDCRAAAVLTDRSCLWSLKVHRVRAHIAALSLKRDYTSKLDWIATDEAASHGPSDFPDAHSDILFLQYTSGSTSDPRGVMVTHRNILSNCDAVVDHRPVTVSWLPQYHDMGLIAFYLFTAVKGGTTYGFSPIDFMQRPLLWFEAMSRFRATASAAPSFAYEYCLRRDKLPDESLEHVDLGSLRVLLNGAEPVRADVFRDFLIRFEPRGLAASSFSAAYGLAEYTLAVTGHGRGVRWLDAARLTQNLASAAQPKTGAVESRALVSCGRPLGPTEVRIVDVTGSPREAPAGQVGEVWVTGPSKCLGYWGKPELSAQVFEARFEDDSQPQRRWLRTGDLGFVEDGELFICGRAKDLIILRGANYYPQDIEAVVEEDPAIRRGCVAAFAAEEDGRDVLVAVAELRNETGRPDALGINRNIRQRLGIGVDLFLFIPKRTIPKTSSGKISRHRALALWRGNGLRVVHRVEPANMPVAGASHGMTRDSATNGVVGERRLANLFHKYGLTGKEELTLLEAGLDSLALVNFTLDLEKHLEADKASGPAGGIQVHWLHNIPIQELFDLVSQLDGAAPHAKLRFRQAFGALRREHLENEMREMRRDARLVVEVPRLPGVAADIATTSGGILLTAGTGFFGPFLLWSLLEQGDDAIYVLVRARDADHAWQRLEEGLASLGVPLTGSPIEGWRRRVVPVCGDLSRPQFGVSAAQWTFLCERIHTVYHNGAQVNYLLDYASMRDTNVRATRELIRLAATGRTKVLNHISTTFVFGWSTRETLFESDTNQDMELLDFGYSQSKWVAEQLVLDAMQRGLPGRVFRPALIAPSGRGGGYNFDITIRMLAFMLAHGISTTAQNQVSLTPADVAANNIVAISNLADTVGKTFHVTRDTFSSLLDVTGILGDLTQTRFVSYPVKEFVPLMIERCRKGDLLFPLVNFLVHSVDNIMAMEFKRYDSRNYQDARARSPACMPDPPLEDVVRGIVRFMARHGIIQGRVTEPAFDRL